MINLVWEDENFSPIAREESRKIGNVFVKAAPTMNSEAVGGYGNYGDAEATTPSVEKAKAMWGVNYPRLQQIKAKYDPNGIFNKWFNIPDFSS